MAFSSDENVHHTICCLASVKLTYIFGVHREIIESDRFFVVKDIERLWKLQYQTPIMNTTKECVVLTLSTT